jgi:outer membrane protein TolC
MTSSSHSFLRIGLAVLHAFLGVTFAQTSAPPSANTSVFMPAPRVIALEDCLSEAMQNNRRRPASRFSVAIAEAQHRQALAAYWPQLSAKVAFQRMDESPNFLFPAFSIPVPDQTINVPAGVSVVTVPAGVLGPSEVQLPITTPAQSLTANGQQVPVPSRNVKLMDPDSVLGSLNLTWLLYDGGMRKGLREQSRGLVDMMKEEARRTDLEIADSVKRLYYGCVLAHQLLRIGEDTLARMETTLRLTETMYQEGSGRVKKTDFLDNKVIVESLRSMVAMLEKNEVMAQAALANTMGMPWNAGVKPADDKLPFSPLTANLEAMVGTAYRFNPDWVKIEAGLRAAEGAVQAGKSEYFPKVALTGELHKWYNDYDAGIATGRNKTGWTVGIGAEIPLFSGFSTRNKIAETRARVSRIKEEQLLLKEGIGLQIKDLFLGLHAAQKSCQATFEALKAAEENRDLNTRAYQSELVETEKVIRAQLVEAVMAAQHYKVCYDHLALQSQLNLLVGTEVLRQLQNAR